MPSADPPLRRQCPPAPPRALQSADHPGDGPQVRAAPWAGLPGTMDAIVAELVAGRPVEEDTGRLAGAIDELMVDLTDADIEALGRPSGDPAALEWRPWGGRPVGRASGRPGGRPVGLSVSRSARAGGFSSAAPSSPPSFFV